MVFNGATFDGKFCSNVANSAFKGIRCNNCTIIQGHVSKNAGGSKTGRFLGVTDEGLKVQVYADTKNLPFFPHAGFALDNSINLTPFRRIRVGYVLKDVAYRVPISGGNASIEINILAAQTFDFNDINYDGFKLRNYNINLKTAKKVHIAESNNGLKSNDFVQQYFELDTSSLQGHHFLLFGANADVSHNTCHINASFVINHIELIN